MKAFQKLLPSQRTNVGEGHPVLVARGGGRNGRSPAVLGMLLTSQLNVYSRKMFTPFFRGEGVVYFHVLFRVNIR